MSGGDAATQPWPLMRFRGEVQAETEEVGERAGGQSGTTTPTWQSFCYGGNQSIRRVRSSFFSLGIFLGLLVSAADELVSNTALRQIVEMSSKVK